MSVIYLSNRVTNSNEDFEKFKKSSESLIFFDSNKKDNFSIDFTVGERWAEYTGQGPKSQFSKVQNNLIEIKPKQSVIIETKEKIMVPHNLFGLIMPTGQLFLQHGIICNTAKIEPGYEDKLFLLLFNSSIYKKKLMVGDKITTAIFLSTEQTPNSVIRKNRQYPNQVQNYNFLRKLKDSIKSNYLSNPSRFFYLILQLLVGFAGGAFFTYLVKNNFFQ